MKSIDDRLWENVDKTSNPKGCWEWRGFTAPSGYGHIHWKTRPHRVHRVSWELLRGLIPDGMYMDHLCRNKICVNPEHLEIVTPRENVIRGISPAALRSKQAHCIRGHLLAGENLYLKKGVHGIERQCRECGRERCRRWKSENPSHKDRRRERDKCRHTRVAI